MEKETHIKSFVRRKGKMSKAQKISYETHFGTYCIDFVPGTDIRDFLPFPHKPLVIEIGFGMGDATVEIARAQPDIMFIGLEVHTPGIGKLLYNIEEHKLNNVRIIAHDAVDVVSRMIPEESIRGFHVFFPDPWPKKRHHKRRLLQPDFISLLGSRLSNDGYVYAVTDWREYADEILHHFDTCSEFINPYSGFCPPLPWRPETRFEEKGRLKDHGIFEIYCTKRLD
ncbi:MAG: tRNA (guanosine(46)-N7)-methyltransferase TrmB [Spirochaetales bacterium]|nr:tRNA (guanosine(46)-N7)-methyltransferase TrmB [Spirochaetales bacterium]